MIQIQLTKNNYNELRNHSLLGTYLDKFCENFYKEHYYGKYTTIAYKYDKEFVTWIMYPSFYASDYVNKFIKYFKELEKQGYEIYY
jgi:hypothetical protein